MAECAWILNDCAKTFWCFLLTDRDDSSSHTDILASFTVPIGRYNIEWSSVGFVKISIKIWDSSMKWLLDT